MYNKEVIKKIMYKINKNDDLSLEKKINLLDFHNNCFLILEEIKKICKKNNIVFSLFGGTMLGQIRHHSFIPWDDDADIVFTRSNYNKFISAWNKTHNKKFKLIAPEDHNGYFFDMTSKIVNTTKKFNSSEIISKYDEICYPWVDLFILDKIPNSKIKQKICFFRLKTLYLMLISKRKFRYGQNHDLKEKLLLIFRFFGKIFSFEKLVRRYKKISTRYNKKNYNTYFCSNDIIKSLEIIYSNTEIKKILYLDFCNKKYPCYKGYNSMLKKQYGNYLKLPNNINSYIRHFR